MSRDYLRQVEDQDRDKAADMAEAWGYPRKIELEERTFGAWMALFREGISPPGPLQGQRFHTALAFAWFVDVPDGLWGWLAVHAAGNPSERAVRTLGTDRNMAALCLVAELMGGTRLYSVIPKAMRGSGLPVDTMRRFLRIRGWKADQLGMYTELGVER